jgi:hypothetical protein
MVLREKPVTRCYAVDSSAGDTHARHNDETVYRELRRFHDARYRGLSAWFRITFEEAHGMIADGSVDSSVSTAFIATRRCATTS